MMRGRLVDIMEIDAVFYDLPDGTEPASEFLRGLDKKMRAKMVFAIALLESFGAEIREPQSEIERAMRYRNEYLNRKENPR